MELRAVGVTSEAAPRVARALARPSGFVVICGPAGTGKTQLAEVLALDTGAPMLGDLRMPDEIVGALQQAERTLVIAVVRSGESRGLLQRWGDMGIEASAIERGSVTIVTLRRVDDVLVVEVIGPDGTLLTGSLWEEACALVSANILTAEAVRFNVPRPT